TKISAGPECTSDSCTNNATLALSRTSRADTQTRSPHVADRSALSSGSLPRRAPMQTVIPSSRKRRAIIFPIPLRPPVMIATLGFMLTFAPFSFHLLRLRREGLITNNLLHRIELSRSTYLHVPLDVAQS